MDEINPEFIEKYQILYQKDPTSKVFAPLAEAYRRMGMLKEALDICKNGVENHPNFPSGHVALGHIHFDMKDFENARESLENATSLSPENILAFELLAQTHLRLKSPKEALKAYKMVLFLKPDSEKALNAVRKLESLTADEYEEELFSMKPLVQAVNEWENAEDKVIPLEPEVEEIPEEASENEKLEILERFISLADAFIVRNDIPRAEDTLSEAERRLGSHPEIIKRFKLINQRHIESPDFEKTMGRIDLKKLNRKDQNIKNKIEFLQGLLSHVKNQSRSEFEENDI